jgi:flagellar biosynthesis protein FlhG
MLGVDCPRTLDDLRAGRAEPEELLVSVAERLTLLSAHSPPTAEPLSAAERKLLFRRTTSLYPRFDFIVVDAGSTVDSIVTACADGADRFLAVTAADRIAVVSTYALIKLLHLRCPNVALEVLANRCDDDAATRTIDSLSEACERFLHRPVTFAGAVPDDPNFTNALAGGISAVDAAAGSPAADALRAIGARIAPTTNTLTPRADAIARVTTSRA